VSQRLVRVFSILVALQVVLGANRRPGAGPPGERSRKPKKERAAEAAGSVLIPLDPDPARGHYRTSPGADCT
jgi:hypothetical protein